MPNKAGYVRILNNNNNNSNNNDNDITRVCMLQQQRGQKQPTQQRQQQRQQPVRVSFLLLMGREGELTNTYIPSVRREGLLLGLCEY